MLPVLPASRRTTDHRLATTPSCRRSRRRRSRSTMVWRPSPSRLLSGLPCFVVETLLYRGRGVRLCVTFVRLGWAPARFDGRGWDDGRAYVLLPLTGRPAPGLCARVDGDGPANPVLVCLLVVPHSRTHCKGSSPSSSARSPISRAGLVYTDRTAVVALARWCSVTRSHREERRVMRQLVSGTAEG